MSSLALVVNSSTFSPKSLSEFRDRKYLDMHPRGRGKRGRNRKEKKETKKMGIMMCGIKMRNRSNNLYETTL